MKSVFLFLVAFCATFAMTGCGGDEGGTVVDSATQSDVDTYNELMAESMAGYEDAEKAMQEGGADK